MYSNCDGCFCPRMNGSITGLLLSVEQLKFPEYRYAVNDRVFLTIAT